MLQDITQDSDKSRLRLPIHHRDYRYPVSRNPYWHKLRTLVGRIYPDNESEAHPGRWRELMPDADTLSKSDPAGAARRKLHVELGCNAGHVVLEWAARDPGNAYVGVDWKFKIIFWAAEKAVKRRIDNVLFFRCHNERLPFIFAPGEIDFLYLYFPDPWPKKAQWKNRYVNADRLRELAPLLSKEGVFHIKTDHPGYYDWIRKAVAEVSDVWEIADETADLHADHPAPETLKIPDVTLFERIFIRERIKIHSLKLRPKNG